MKIFSFWKNKKKREEEKKCKSEDRLSSFLKENQYSLLFLRGDYIEVSDVEGKVFSFALSSI